MERSWLALERSETWKSPVFARQGSAQMPPLQMPDSHTFPQEPQFDGSDCRFAQNLRPPDRQIWLGGQQSGGMPGGGVRNPGLLSATIPGGQQSRGVLLSRSCGQQIDGVPGLTPMFPRRIGTAHFVRGGQQTWLLSVTQQERFFGQQPALPQQRLVRLSQHLRSHSSSFGPQRLHSPVEGFTQRQFLGQHLSLPQRARPCGQRGTQIASAGLIDRTHSSLGAQHRSAHRSSPCLQHSPRAGLAQNSPGLQHSSPQGRGHFFGLQIATPGSQMHSYFSKSQQTKLQMVVSGGMRFAGRSLHLQRSSLWRSHTPFAR
jgi:hypothetical protein